MEGSNQQGLCGQVGQILQGPAYSVVIPVYNEEASLPELAARLLEVTCEIGQPFELIFVDDGSVDSSFSVLHDLVETHSGIRAIRLSRNFGHQKALAAGLDHANGRAVITMDSDLQHPPEVIPKLLEKWNQGYEVVHTVRVGTDQEGRMKKLASHGFYWLMGKIAEIPITANAPDFRLLDRRAVNALQRMREQGRFTRGLVDWMGYSRGEVVFRAPVRCAGESKYSFRRMLALATSAVTSFSLFPLRLATFMGFAVAGLGVLYGCFILYAIVSGAQTVPGWSSTVLAVLVLGGTQLIVLGIIGEYIGRVLEEVRGRPLYLVQTKLGFDKDSQC